MSNGTTRTATSRKTKTAADKQADKRPEPTGLQALIARRVDAATTTDGPDETFMRLIQRPVWDLLCDHYFRLEIEGWHRIPDQPSLVIGVHSGGSLTMDAWTLVHSWLGAALLEGSLVTRSG